MGPQYRGDLDESLDESRLPEEVGVGAGNFPCPKTSSYQEGVYIPSRASHVSIISIVSLPGQPDTDRMSQKFDYPVIIVGGGGCGLSMSSFLSNYGVPHVLFERKERPSPLPKAHYLNQRAMETFRQHDIHKEIMERGTPPEHMQRVAWVTSLGGNDRLDRKVVHTIPSFGNDPASEQAKMYKLDAAARSANLPLSRSEPILHKLAEERNPGNVRFRYSVTDFQDHGDHVEVTVKSTTSGSESKFRARYLIGADGGRVVGPKIGVQMRGPTNIVDMVTVHFKADLSEYWDDRIFLCYLINGESGTVFESGAIVPVGPTWGKDSEEWVFHFGFALDDDSRFDENKLVGRIRDLLKLPALQLKVERISHWIIESVLANKYREGNVFIAGDAAHRRPPTTGLGLNTAIEDAFNLSWKLAMVFNHNADPKILDTYEQERRPVGQRNVDWGLFTFENSAVINSALGLIAGQKERNKARFEAVFADTLTGRSLHAQVNKMIDSQSIEFGAHGVELGFVYENGALIPDGTDTPPEDPLGQQYFPTTRPGHRLPHAWLGSFRTLVRRMTWSGLKVPGH